MMELKAYQRGALETLTRWLENLEETRRDSENMIEALKQIRADAPISENEFLEITARLNSEKYSTRR